MGNPKNQVYKQSLRWLLLVHFLLATASALAQPDARCWQALRRADPSDSPESHASHFAHESVWEVRDALWYRLKPWQKKRPDLTQPWRTYVSERYGRFFDRYSENPVQWMSLQDRIDAAGNGSAPDLGELQIAEKYLLDPLVRTVEFIPQSLTEGERTPDLHVYFLNGDSKFVEVKTRTPGNLPNWDLISERLEKADKQVASYKDRYKEFDAARADVEVVHHFPGFERLSATQIQEIVDIAEFWFEETVSITRMVLHFNNRPFLRLTHKFVRGQWTVITEYLTAPKTP